jgi:N-(5-amino-5-carboxypentanoyl)-L-cysteinyl-D-valine synthase
LGEIEAILSSYPEITKSIVVAKDRLNKKPKESHKYLIGYFVSNTMLSSHEIRRFMQSKLPDYMIPTHLIQIEKVPTTVSGKLDTKALPLAKNI